MSYVILAEAERLRANRIRRLRRRLSSVSKITVRGDELLVQRRRSPPPLVHYHGTLSEVETYFATRQATRGFRTAPHWPCASDDS